MHTAGKPRMKSGYRDATTVMRNNGGTFEHYPAQAWARLGNRMMCIDAENGLEPHQLVAKCEALVRNGAGWVVRD